MRHGVSAIELVASTLAVGGGTLTCLRALIGSASDPYCKVVWQLVVVATSSVDAVGRGDQLCWAWCDGCSGASASGETGSSGARLQEV